MGLLLPEQEPQLSSGRRYRKHLLFYLWQGNKMLGRTLDKASWTVITNGVMNWGVCSLGNKLMSLGSILYCWKMWCALAQPEVRREGDADKPCSNELLATTALLKQLLISNTNSKGYLPPGVCVSSMGSWEGWQGGSGGAIPAGALAGVVVPRNKFAGSQWGSNLPLALLSCG